MSNQELVEQRLATQREIKAARAQSVQERNERHFKLKRMLHTNASNIPEMYAVRVSVCDDLREELRLSGKEKRGRVFIERTSNATKSLNNLRFELQSFFRALRRSTFVLSGAPPIIESDGRITSPASNSTDSFWSIDSDEDVKKTFMMADDLFESNSNILKRPSIAIHVRRDPNAPPPPPPPAYLENMANPDDTESMTMLSFYAFPPKGIEDPEEFATALRKRWKPFKALGRVYVAKEGVNAQMSVPTNVLARFSQCCQDVPELGDNMENGINIDPVPVSVDEFAFAGTPVNGKPAPPFRNLHIRVRNQIVADGLDKELNWQSAGYDMPPLEWHEKLKEAREMKQQGEPEKSPIILDCRNTYETDVGIFDGAEPLKTESFRDSWKVLKNRLEDTPKDAPIMAYCTGGIRCVKVGAYLTQELGFTNVSRLAGGIIAYDRRLNEVDDQDTDESMFKGTNFVFDGRLGRAITDDTLGSCVTCGAETSFVTNCLNENCHQRMTQCEACRTNYHGTCSDACRDRVINSAMAPRRGSTSSTDMSTSTGSTFNNLNDYATQFSSPIPSIYEEIELNTKSLIPTGSHMVSGGAQGRLLSQLASLTREGRVLELGTFTGYATACLLEGASNVADLTGNKEGDRENGPFVMTLERDGRAYDVAVAHLEAMCHAENDSDVVTRIANLRSSGINSVPNIDERSRRFQYRGVGCELRRVTDALATVEEIASNKNSERYAPFDLIFIDADKTRLLEYAEACLGSDYLLKKGGILVVDNVLWKGLVLEAASGDFSSLKEDDFEDDQWKKNRRARKLASKMHYFNSQIVQDNRAEVVVLPVRDGLSVIRKR